MLKSKSATTLLFILLLLCSCSSGSGNSIETADATLLWSGEYMVDGCGFEVLMDAKKYKPENEDAIGETFKNGNRHNIVLQFVRLDTTIDRRCGLSTESREMEGIRIVSVKAK